LKKKPVFFFLLNLVSMYNSCPFFFSVWFGSSCWLGHVNIGVPISFTRQPDPGQVCETPSPQANIASTTLLHEYSCSEFTSTFDSPHSMTTQYYYSPPQDSASQSNYRSISILHAYVDDGSRRDGLRCPTTDHIPHFCSCT
jgi:hypothetical protein